MNTQSQMQNQTLEQIGGELYNNLYLKNFFLNRNFSFTDKTLYFGGKKAALSAIKKFLTIAVDEYIKKYENDERFLNFLAKNQLQISTNTDNQDSKTIVEIENNSKISTLQTADFIKYFCKLINDFENKTQECDLFITTLPSLLKPSYFVQYLQNLEIIIKDEKAFYYEEEVALSTLQDLIDEAIHLYIEENIIKNDNPSAQLFLKDNDRTIEKSEDGQFFCQNKKTGLKDYGIATLLIIQIQLAKNIAQNLSSSNVLVIKKEQDLQENLQENNNDADKEEKEYLNFVEVLPNILKNQYFVTHLNNFGMEVKGEKVFYDEEEVDLYPIKDLIDNAIHEYVENNQNNQNSQYLESSLKKNNVKIAKSNDGQFFFKDNTTGLKNYQKTLFTIIYIKTISKFYEQVLNANKIQKGTQQENSQNTNKNLISSEQQLDTTPKSNNEYNNLCFKFATLFNRIITNDSIQSHLSQNNLIKDCKKYFDFCNLIIESYQLQQNQSEEESKYLQQTIILESKNISDFAINLLKNIESNLKNFNGEAKKDLSELFSYFLNNTLFSRDLFFYKGTKNFDKFFEVLSKFSNQEASIFAKNYEETKNEYFDFALSFLSVLKIDEMSPTYETNYNKKHKEYLEFFDNIQKRLQSCDKSQHNKDKIFHDLISYIENKGEEITKFISKISTAIINNENVINTANKEYILHTLDYLISHISPELQTHFYNNDNGILKLKKLLDDQFALLYSNLSQSQSSQNQKLQYDKIYKDIDNANLFSNKDFDLNDYEDFNRQIASHIENELNLVKLDPSKLKISAGYGLMLNLKIWVAQNNQIVEPGYQVIIIVSLLYSIIKAQNSIKNVDGQNSDSDIQYLVHDNLKDKTDCLAEKNEYIKSELQKTNSNQTTKLTMSMHLANLDVLEKNNDNNHPSVDSTLLKDFALFDKLYKKNYKMDFCNRLYDQNNQKVDFNHLEKLKKQYSNPSQNSPEDTRAVIFLKKSFIEQVKSPEMEYRKH